MDEPEIFIIETKLSNELIQYEYRVEEIPDQKKSKKFKFGLVEIPRLVVYVLCIIFIGIIAISIAALIIFNISKVDAIYGESCKTKSCSKDLNLKCIDEICKCESSKYYKGYCADLSKYGESCLLNTDCDTVEGLTCIYSRCDCPLNFFWNQILFKCMERRSYNQDCFGDECILNVSLNCNLNSGLCECIDNSKHYWNGTMCVDKKSYSQSCSTDIECLTDYELTFCDESKCNCTDRQYYDSSTSKCTNRVGENMTCDFNDMCLTPMFCSSLKRCTCPITQFYDPFNHECINKYLNEEFCNSDNECREDLGLKCQGSVCLCQAPNYVWYSQGLECKLNYSYSVCSSDSDCNPNLNLICMSNCTCPSVSGNGICDCKRVKGDEFYWDGSSCVSALPFGSPCSNDYECQTLTQNSFCNPTTGLCDCAIPGGYSLIDKLCKKCFSDEVYYNGMCYYFSSTTENKDNSKIKCDSMNIDGESRKSDLLVLIAEDVITFTASQVNSNTNYWISGLIDYGSKYKWDISGYGQVDTNICNFNVGSDSCLYYSADEECFFNNFSCGTYLNYICQRKSK